MASERGQSFLSLIKKSASPKTSVRPRRSPRVNSISLASGCASVPRNLIGKFLSDSVIDSILRLRHPRICAGPNEVWLPSTTQEFNHTWESEQARVWAGEGASGDGEHSKVRGAKERGYSEIDVNRRGQTKTEELTDQSCDRWTSRNCDNSDDNKSVEVSANMTSIDEQLRK